MYRRNVLLLAGALCAFALPVCAPPPAIGQEAPATAGASLTASENQARGNADDWVRELCDDVARAPETPAARAALGLILNLMGSLTDPTFVEAKLGPVLDRGVRDGEIDEVLREILANRAAARGEIDTAREFRATAGYLRRFAVLGPVDQSGSSRIWRRYAPETGDIDFTQPVQGKRGAVRWLTLPVLGDSAWVNPYGQIRRGGSGVNFAVAHVRVPEPMTVGLKMWCSTSARVSVNGHDAIVADRSWNRTPDVLWGRARLVAGWNRVLVKLSSRVQFALKVVDGETGLPIPGLEEGSPTETQIARRAPAPAEPLGYRRPWLRAQEAAGDGAGLNALATAAILAGDEGRDWESLGYWERAAAQAPSSIQGANVTAAYGRTLADFSVYPPVHRKLLAKVQFERAKELDPLHNSANIRLANFENDDDRPEKAVDALQKYIEQNPSPTALMALARVSGGRNWEKEALDAAATALDMAPNMQDAADFLTRYDRRYGNHDALVARTKKRLAADASDRGAAADLIASLRARGNEDEAFTLLKTLAERYPQYTGYRAQIAEILRNRGEHDASIAAWTELSKLIPEEERYPREIGELHEIAGRKDEAVKAYRASLALSPFQPRLWRAIGRLTGQEFDFATGWEPDVEQIMAELPSDEELKAKYPKAVALTVLDHSVERILPDGSSISFVNMLYKLLDEKGVQKYSDMPNSGEVLEIAAHLPDGTKMLPTGLGRQSFNMEGLVPGTFVHHRFVSFRGPRDDGKYNGGKFYFQDYELGNNPNPVLRSRWVLLTPSDMELSYKAHLFDEGPKTEDVDGLTATIWEKRDMPRIDSEAMMPEVDEIVPYVDYGKAPTFEDANWDYLESRGGTWPTPVLQEVVDDVCKADMDDRAKIEALHAWVNEEIKGDTNAVGNPSAIVIEKSGNRRHLYEALLRTADIPFRHGRAMPWNGVGMELAEATPAAFRGRFLWLEPRGSDPIPFWIGERLEPFGNVPRPYRDSSAFLTSERGGEIVRLPEAGLDTRDTTELTIRLGATPEDVTVGGRITWRQSGGYRFKKQYTEMSADAQQKLGEGQLGRYFAGAELTSFDAPDVEKHGTPLVFAMQGKMPRYLSAQGDRFVAKLHLPTADLNGRFVHRSERKYDLILRPRDVSYDRMVIHLGDHFDLAKLPEDHLAVSDVGVYSLTFRRVEDRIEVERYWSFKPARYEPDDYPRFIQWCKAVDDAENVQLEFVKLD